MIARVGPVLEQSATLSGGGAKVKEKSRRKFADLAARRLAPFRRVAWVIAALITSLTLAAPFSPAAVAQTSGGSGLPTVKVWFLDGEQLIATLRSGSTPRDAVQDLLNGPTAAEYKQGYRTYVPAGTKLRSLTVANGTATVDVSLSFALGSNGQNLDARLSQLVRTASGLDGVTKVRLLVDGGTVYGMFPGIVTALPITFQQLATPDVPVWSAVSAAPAPAVPDLLVAQRRLVALGYLLPGDADRTDGPQTQTAVLAFQKWEGLTRDGVLGPQTMARLKTATRPTPITRGGAVKEPRCSSTARSFSPSTTTG